MIADRWVTTDYDVARTRVASLHGVADIGVDIAGACQRQFRGLSYQLAGIHVAPTGHFGVQKIHAAKGRYVPRALDAKIEDGLLRSYRVMSPLPLCGYLALQAVLLRQYNAL